MYNYLKNNNNIDEIYRNIAKEKQTKYIELTSHFKSLEKKNAYFFTFDGHPNENGYQEIAKFIGYYLIENKIIER